MCQILQLINPCKTLLSLSLSLSLSSFSLFPAMNRAWLIRLTTRLANSVISTQCQRANSFSLTQVTRFSHLIQYHHLSLSRKPHISANQVLFFSSKPETLVNIVISNNWSEEIENELEKLDPKLTHESVIYVLLKLSKDPQKCLDFFKWVRDRKGFEPSSVVYNILLRYLAGKDYIKQFWDVALEMKGKGFPIGTQTYLTVHGILKRDKLDKDRKDLTDFYKKMSEGDDKIRVVKDVVEMILKSDWTEEVEGKLKKLKFPLSENFLLAVYKELWKLPLKALKFFDWVRQCRGYKHNAVTYNAMAKVLAQEESMGKFWDLIKRMRSEGYEIDTDTYLKISRRLRNGDAVELFEYMMDGPYKLSQQNCSMLLKNLAFERNPDMDLVYRVVNKFEEAGNTRTKAIYDGIHRSLCKNGRFNEAQEIVEAMRAAGYKPDNITYSQELHGLSHLRRLEEAGKVLEHMEEVGCVPDLKTWTILIQGCCSAGLLDEALLYLGKMMEKKIDPDADLLQTFVNGFLSQNKLNGAYTFFIEMVTKAHLKPWQATYKLMIEKLLEAGKLEEAHNLLSMMKQHNYPPFPEPFVQYISKYGTLEDAKKLIYVLPVNGYPSTSAYVHVITSFINEGRHSEAKDLIYESPRQVRTSKAIVKLFGSAKSNTDNPSSFVKDGGPHT